jgi:hypothetical protein
MCCSNRIVQLEEEEWWPAKPMPVGPGGEEATAPSCPKYSLRAIHHKTSRHSSALVIDILPYELSVWLYLYITYSRPTLMLEETSDPGILLVDQSGRPVSGDKLSREWESIQRRCGEGSPVSCKRLQHIFSRSMWRRPNEEAAAGQSGDEVLAASNGAAHIMGKKLGTAICHYALANNWSYCTARAIDSVLAWRTTAVTSIQINQAPSAGDRQTAQLSKGPPRSRRQGGRKAAPCSASGEAVKIGRGGRMSRAAVALLESGFSYRKRVRQAREEELEASLSDHSLTSSKTSGEGDAPTSSQSRSSGGGVTDGGTISDSSSSGTHGNSIGAGGLEHTTSIRKGYRQATFPTEVTRDDGEALGGGRSRASPCMASEREHGVGANSGRRPATLLTEVNFGVGGALSGGRSHASPHMASAGEHGAGANSSRQPATLLTEVTFGVGGALSGGRSHDSPHLASGGERGAGANNGRHPATPLTEVSFHDGCALGGGLGGRPHMAPGAQRVEGAFSGFHQANHTSFGHGVPLGDGHAHTSPHGGVHGAGPEGQAPAMRNSKRCSPSECARKDNSLQENNPTKKQRGLLGWIGSYLLWK